MRDGLKRFFRKTIHPTLKRYDKGAKKEGPEISVEETHHLLEKGEGVILLDVREKKEIALGYIKGAVLIPKDLLKQKAQTLLTEKDIPIIAYCAAGGRSLSRRQAIKRNGIYESFFNGKGV